MREREFSRFCQRAVVARFQEAADFAGNHCFERKVNPNFTFSVSEFPAETGLAI
jgi:hypothetical protein